VKTRSGHLFKRNGTWYVQWRIDGKLFMRSTRTKNRKEAEKERARILAPFMAKDEAETLRNISARIVGREAEILAFEESKTPPLKIDHAQAAYRDSKLRPDSGDVTLSRYHSQFGRFRHWMSGEYPDKSAMREIDEDLAQHYVRDLENAGLSPSTFNQHVQTLRRFWKVLQREIRGDGANPWKEIATKTLDRTARRKRPLSLDRLADVLAVAKNPPEGFTVPGCKAGDVSDVLSDAHDLIVSLVCTGQRLGDVCQLEHSAVDLKSGVIELVPAKTRRRKGEPVLVPILPPMREVLAGRQKRTRYVFPMLAEIYQKDAGITVSKTLQALLSAAGLPVSRPNDREGARAVVQYGAHSLRHSFVTIARAAGMPDAMVQKITGHGSTRMVDHYTAFDRAQITKVSRELAPLQLNGKGEIKPPIDVRAAESVMFDATPFRALVEKLPDLKTVRPIKSELLALLAS